MKQERIWLSTPTMHGEELQFVHEAFEKNWIAPLGFNVDGFEREMAEYLGIGHAAALTAGTAALHLAMKLAGVGQGDLVLCSDLTFSATGPLHLPASSSQRLFHPLCAWFVPHHHSAISSKFSSSDKPSLTSQQSNLLL